jgi:glycosyltransferase involved in cell wall biosynthesis
MLTIYSSADAVVTYGAHVSAYVRARGARNVHVAPQAVDNGFWSAPAGEESRRAASFTALFVGRPVPEKGLAVLHEAWRACGLGTKGAVLLVAGTGPEDPGLAGSGRAGPGRAGPGPGPGIEALGPQSPPQLRNLYAAADVLIMPSVRTRSFREPWGLVANEALNQSVPVIASDEVGAAAGGLVRHERNGLIVRAGNVADLTAAILRLCSAPAPRAGGGGAAPRDVAAFTQAAWAAGFAAALRSVSASKEPC